MLVSGKMPMVDVFAVNGVARLYSNRQAYLCDETTGASISTESGSVSTKYF